MPRGQYQQEGDSACLQLAVVLSIGDVNRLPDLERFYCEWAVSWGDTSSYILSSLQSSMGCKVYCVCPDVSSYIAWWSVGWLPRVTPWQGPWPKVQYPSLQPHMHAPQGCIPLTHKSEVVQLVSMGFMKLDVSSFHFHRWMGEYWSMHGVAKRQMYMAHHSIPQFLSSSFDWTRGKLLRRRSLWILELDWKDGKPYTS